MLRAYFDDSGTHDESKAVVVGGLIGTVAQWKGFETAWAAKLADPLPEARKPPLQVFHLSECVGRWPGSEFAHYTDAERDAVIHDFRQIIISSGLIGMGAAIDLVAWDELVYGRDEEGIENPLEICAARCIEQAIAIADPHPEGDAIAVFFDQGIETDNLHGIVDPYTYPLGRPRVMSINFAQVRCVLPLQAADMVATEDYWHALRWIDEGDSAEARAHLRHFLAHAPAEAFILGREEIAAELERRKAERDADDDL